MVMSKRPSENEDKRISVDFPAKQRALVLQGPVALGAYEAGVFSALYKNLSEKDKLNGSKSKPLFDIVAGTSAGAMNAAILVSHVKSREHG